MRPSAHPSLNRAGGEAFVGGAICMPSLVVSEKVYRRLRELAEAKAMSVEELVLSLATEGMDPKEVAQIYWETAESLLTRAQEELAKGNLRQASEKMWGAAALAVKALAHELEGRRLASHGELWEFVGELSRRAGDVELGRLWRSASSMHVNFYEGWASREHVEDALSDVRELINRLKRLRPSKPS